MIVAIAGLLIVIAFLVRSASDISYYVGPDEDLQHADTSGGHWGRMVVWFVVGLVILFFL